MSGEANKKYLDVLVSDAKEKILSGIASHYGISIEDAYDEVVDKDAEYLFEYMVSNDRMKVYKAMNEFGLVK